jgi:hypothetical protein
VKPHPGPQSRPPCHFSRPPISCIRSQIRLHRARRRYHISAPMPSQRQIVANRRNAKKSTGPQTPEGRDVVHSNALRHGLTAQTAVLANENREHFDEMLEAFHAEYHPAGPTENLLVHQMVMAAWRLARMRGIETGLFNLGLSDLHEELETNYTGIEENERQAFVFRNDAANPRSMENLFRYESRIGRSTEPSTSCSGFALADRPSKTQQVTTVRATKQILQIKANPRIGHHR